MCNIQISLAAARKNAKMTMDAASEALRVSKSTLCRWEKENKAPYAAVMLMASIYKLPAEAFSALGELAKSE